VRPPLLITAQMFPSRQLGIKAHGTLFLNDLRLEYALYISNGRALVANVDLDGNKALGGRLELHYTGALDVQLGFSAFGGRYTDIKHSIDPSVQVQAPILPRVTEEVTEQFDELDLEADLTLGYRALTLRAVVAYNQHTFAEGRRPLEPVNPAFAFAMGQEISPLADFFAYDAYAELIYALPWFGVRPYFRCEIGSPNDNVSWDNLYGLTGGLNINPLPPLVIKLEAQHMHFYEDRDYTVNADFLRGITRNITILTGQVAVSF
jgi:hypothetical protein